MFPVDCYKFVGYYVSETKVIVDKMLIYLFLTNLCRIPLAEQKNKYLDFRHAKTFIFKLNRAYIIKATIDFLSEYLVDFL